MGEPCSAALSVCWEQWGEQWDVLPAPGCTACPFTSLPAEGLASRTDMCDFRELSLNSWAISVTNTLGNVSALIHTTRFH